MRAATARRQELSLSNNDAVAREMNGGGGRGSDNVRMCVCGGRGEGGAEVGRSRTTSFGESGVCLTGGKLKASEK